MSKTDLLSTTQWGRAMIVVCGGRGAVSEEPSIRNVRIVWGMLVFGGSLSEHQRVLDVSG